MSFFEDAIQSLGVSKYVIKGFIKNETDFYEKFYKIVGKEDNGTAILSNDPSKFGVNWDQIDKQIKIEEQKFKDTQYQRDRLKEYPNTNDLIVALWEKVMEDRSESADALEVKRQEVKTAHPKPE